MADKGLITGYTDTGNFGPLDALTRGQLATILWRNACARRGGRGGRRPVEVRRRRRGEPLVGGYENEDGTRTLAPGEDVSRGRAATVLMRAFDLGIMG